MEIELDNGLRLRLNDKNHTSSIIPSPKVSGNVFVPSFVKYQDMNYKIVSIGSYSFSNTKIESLTFSDDSEITKFENNSFDCAHIKKLQIPKSLKTLEKLSLSCAYDLTEIEVSPKNKIFSNLENQYLVGKINEKSQTYDILFFARTDIKNATINPTIKVLNSYSFFNHNQLNSIIFPFNSKLKIIENNVFSFTSIKKLVLPETVEEIDSSNFCNVRSLVDIQVSQKNKNFSYVNNQYLARKSDKKKSVFDVIVFVRRDIEEFKVPSHIKKIAENAFQLCSHLNSIKFDSQSSLELIEKESFFEISGPEFLIIPPFVKRIGDQAFSHIKNLRFVEIRAKTIELDFSPFCSCKNLEVISFPNASEITFNCDYCFDLIPENTEFHMRKSVTFVGKGLDQFQSRIQFIENEDFKNKIVKFRLKNENQSEKAKEKLNENEDNKKLKDEKINSNDNNEKLIDVKNDEEINDNENNEEIKDVKKLIDNNNDKKLKDEENSNNCEYSSNYNYIDSSSITNTNSTEDSSSDKDSNNTKNNNLNMNENSNQNKNDENDKYQIMMNYIRQIEKRLSKYEKVEPFDFDNYNNNTDKNGVQSSNKICDFKCSICNNVIENDIIFISGVSYHKKCVTSQMSHKTITSHKTLQDLPKNDPNSVFLLKNYNNLSPTKFLSSSLKPQNNISENKKHLINLIDNELIKHSYEIKVIDVKLISNNEFTSKFNQNKLKIPNSIEELFLFHGDSFQKVDKIKEVGFHEKCICANANLFDAFLAANGSDLVKKDQTVSVIFCKSFYDKTKIVEIDDNSSIENQPEIQENFGVQITKNVKNIDSKNFIFHNENQIIPIFLLTVKIPNYFILWKVSKIDEDVKTYKRNFLSILHVNFYCFQSFDKALEMIKLKKKNPIRLITDAGENLSGLKFINEARKIIGSNFLCLVFDKKSDNLDQIQKVENVLFTSSPQFFGKFSSLPMDENKQLNFVDDLQRSCNNQSFNINRKEMIKFPLVDHPK